MRMYLSCSPSLPHTLKYDAVKDRCKNFKNKYCIDTCIEISINVSKVSRLS